MRKRENAPSIASLRGDCPLVTNEATLLHPNRSLEVTPQTEQGRRHRPRRRKPGNSDVPAPGVRLRAATEQAGNAPSAMAASFEANRRRLLRRGWATLHCAPLPARLPILAGLRGSAGFTSCGCCCLNPGHYGCCWLSCTCSVRTYDRCLFLGKYAVGDSSSLPELLRVPASLLHRRDHRPSRRVPSPRSGRSNLWWSTR